MRPELYVRSFWPAFETEPAVRGPLHPIGCLLRARGIAVTEMLAARDGYARILKSGSQYLLLGQTAKRRPTSGREVCGPCARMTRAPEMAGFTCPGAAASAGRYLEGTRYAGTQATLGEGRAP